MPKQIPVEMALLEVHRKFREVVDIMEDMAASLSSAQESGGKALQRVRELEMENEKLRSQTIPNPDPISNPATSKE